MKSQSVVLPDGIAVPRVRHAPHVRANAWEDVTELAAGYGLSLLDWQENVFEATMGERADGSWAAKHVGLCCPRQNGKGSILEARALAGLLLFDEQMIIHSAHEVRTAQLGFRRLKSYFENYDDLRRKVVGGVMRWPENIFGCVPGRRCGSSPDPSRPLGGSRRTACCWMRARFWTICSGRRFCTRCRRGRRTKSGWQAPRRPRSSRASCLTGSAAVVSTARTIDSPGWSGRRRRTLTWTTRKHGQCRIPRWGC